MQPKTPAAAPKTRSAPRTSLAPMTAASTVRLTRPMACAVAVTVNGEARRAARPPLKSPTP